MILCVGDLRCLSKARMTKDEETFNKAVAELQSITDGAEPVTRRLLKPNVYTDPEIINPVFVALLNYFEKHFRRYARKVPVNTLMSMFMKKYEDAFGEYQRTGVLPTSLPNNYGSPATVQKALLFGLERSLLLNRPWPVAWILHKWRLLKEKMGMIDESRTAIDYEAAELCVTNMVEEAESSDQIHGIYKDHTTLTIRPPRREDEPRETYKFLQTELDPQLKELMKEYGDAKEENKKKKVLFKGRDLPSEYETRKKALDAIFKEHIGATFDEVRTILMSFDHERPWILREHQIVGQISKQFGFSKEVINRVIDGLLLSKKKLRGDTPVWKLTRQKNRITRKPIMRIRLWDGYNYLGWSPVILREILNHFSELMIFGELPDEWLTDKTVRDASEKLSQDVSTWFENEFIRLMSERGFVGREIKKDKVIGRDDAQIKYPKGQIDFLGFNSDLKLLLVAECKLVKWSADAGDENGDFREFIRDYERPKEKTHFDKLISKYEWMCANAPRVMAALKKEYPEIDYGESIKVASVMVTYHPMRISVFAKDLPLRSIVRFLEDFDSVHKWPYDFGIKEIRIEN